ncbi:hypothetical protein FA13DRAFT_1725777 [Coprinellus micaceus]|uniref:Microbial-type PARG catalytic domain-containing protein n=1 Tax=Coprinellus micaceus TaxID=71717 RepID=A0A4Y7TVY5_COPMI|nr:hypothetical protein FA13DRAFT_1725777 [Coprinellus micaceus]
MMKGTSLYGPDNRHLQNWGRPPRRPSWASPPTHVHVEVQKRTTLEGCIYMQSMVPGGVDIGVLNFASATRPGGGFRKGASAQEESLARSSTLFKALESDKVKRFYDQHKADGRDPFYSHAMIYSPRVVFFRDDDGGWLSPTFADVLTCAAVNAKQVRASERYQWTPDIERRIEDTMKERMGRILELFEYRHAKNLVLGSFGTGVFQNDVGMVAGAWRELLRDRGARFRFSFDRVLFAIPDERTAREFEEVFFNDQPRGGRRSGSPERATSHM